MKQIEYDKPRIASTIVLGILLTIFLVFTFLLIGTSWAQLSAAIEESESNADSAGGQVAVAFVLALFGALAMVLVIVVYVLLLIGNGICLIFTLKNRQSTLKPVRIISYVYDGLIGVMMIVAIVKIVMLAVFKV